MISHPKPPHIAKYTQHGNALFYVLMGVVLFAALSYTMMRQNNSTGAAQQISDEQAEIYAAHIINHAATVKAAIQQMLNNGSTIDDIDFMLPDDAAFETPPHIHKLYHPGGGGITPMIVKDDFSHMEAGGSGWIQQQGTNVDWTPSTSTDIMYSFNHTPINVCEAINKQLIGDETIPQMQTSSFGNTFYYGGTDTNFTTSVCPDCEGIYSICILHPSFDRHIFYTIVAAR